MLIKRGDIFYADLNPSFGSEQGGIRPVLVVQNNIGTMHSPTLVVLPIISSKKPILPVHTRVDDTDLLTNGSIALADQIRTIDKRRLRSYIGSLDADAMKRVDKIIKISLDRYEGFPRMYRKELFEVEVDGKIREGMAYLMNCGEIAPPSPTYYNGIKKGYEANGMDTSYLRAALERAVYHVQHQEHEEDEDIEEDMEETDDFQLSFQ